MADPPPYADRESNTGTPRWVKVFGVIAIVLVVLFVTLALIGGGRHGPGRHMQSGSGASVSSLAERGH